jgi:hypothetical protein
MQSPEHAERAQQRVLDEVLGVPHVAREAPAVREEPGPQRCEEIQVAVPRRAQLVAHRVGEIDL